MLLLSSHYRAVAVTKDWMPLVQRPSHSHHCPGPLAQPLAPRGLALLRARVQVLLVLLGEPLALARSARLAQRLAQRLPLVQLGPQRARRHKHRRPPPVSGARPVAVGAAAGSSYAEPAARALHPAWERKQPHSKANAVFKGTHQSGTWKENARSTCVHWQRFPPRHQSAWVYQDSFLGLGRRGVQLRVAHLVKPCIILA